MQYMVNKYGKTDCLYPKEAQKRAMVDQMLYFDMGTLYASFMSYYVSYFEQLLRICVKNCKLKFFRSKTVK